MKIKKLLTTSLLFFLPFFLILYILFCINILIKDFNFGHKSHNTYPRPMDWVKYSYFLNLKKLNNFVFNLTNKQEEGLPRVDIYVPEKTSNLLLSNIPNSTKKYLRSEMLINNEKKEVRMRYFGDNPTSWMFNQKAIRIKTKKSEIVNRKRYFEYRPSQNKVIDEYVAFKIAKKLGLLVSDVRLIELFINEKSNGIYMEKERLNESFLRRNKIMPVNIYKGEASRNSEKKIGLEVNLDHNPGLWEKISFLNITDLDDHRDLIRFSKSVKDAESSNETMNQLLKFQNIDLFARASILEILLNTSISDYTHNKRVAIDVWSGNVHIIPHDITFVREMIDEDNLIRERANSNLFTVINQSSEFLDTKYKILNKVIKEDKIFDEIIEDLESLKEKFLVSKKTDLGTVKRKYVNFLSWTGPENEQNFNNLITSLKERERQIIEFLNSDPECSWNDKDKGFDLKIKKLIPISNLKVQFDNIKPEWIALDYNNNQILDSNDMYFYANEDKNFEFKVKLFANRITSNTEPYYNLDRLITGNTKFTFFVENNIKPSQIATINSHTKKEFILEYNKNKASSPSLNNIPILDNEKKKVNIINGNIFLKEDMIIKDETKILEGTIFTMDEGVSIVFENKVSALGSNEKPIIFKKNNDALNWGTIAIHGADTEGSFLKNIIIEDGSGETINGVNYFAALSIHSTKNINLDNILIKNNSVFDDMMHIIYSENIKVSNSKFLNAFRDSIDVDISKNILFQNTKITNSGNDGLDFMESSAKLSQMDISLSGDKGISVGENSEVFIKDSIINSNKYGIASKDLSKALVEDTLLENNKIQLSVYKKNWRYGGSGIIEIRNSKLLAKDNNFDADELGKINILSSDISGNLKKSKNVKIN